VAPERYVADIDALIQLDRHYRQRFNKLRQLAATGDLVVPEGVYREVMRRTDVLSKRVRKWSDKSATFVVASKSEPRLWEEIARLETLYGPRIRVGNQEYRGFWESAGGRRAADSQVVAVAKLHGRIAVSDDRAIGLACMLEDVQCIGWTEFARRTGVAPTQQQLDLL